MGFTWAGYLGKLEKLRKNREQVPLADLRGKYRKPYMELLRDIKADTETMLIHFLVGGLPFDMSEKAEWDSFVNRVNEIIREANKAGTFKEISRAIFREYDPDKALDIAARTIWPKVWYRAYSPYWIRHCRKRDDGRTWNDLIRMRWRQEWQIWEAEDGTSWRAMLPPSEPQIREEEERERERIQSTADQSAADQKANKAG
nr:hypothetical protein [uncultured Dysosmobacter sp.]